MPLLPVPALKHAFRDPVFGSCISRVTDPGQWPGVSRIRHYYAKSNPFNADNTRALLFTSEGDVLLYDVQSWSPIRALKIQSSDPEIQWHPTAPNLFYYLDFVGKSPNVRALFRYDLQNDSRTALHDFSEYDSVRAKLEGNLDARARYYAMFGFKGEAPVEAFVYDLERDRVLARRQVTPEVADDWISVTPSGAYVVIMGEDRSRVYDIELEPLRDLPKGSYGHGDLCRSADGRDLMVYDGADQPLDGNRNLNIADLATGTVTRATRLGWHTTPHVSCRNLDFPGWALVSTQGPDRKYPNHDFEIFWLKLDGSAEVRRLAHHHASSKDDYFAEPHAVPSRDGTMILFASNWGQGRVNDYFLDLRAQSCGEPR